METVSKQVQVVSGLGVGGPVGPVGPVGADLHHHHHPHPHSHPPHPHAHPHGHPHGPHGHSLVGVTSTPGRGQTQPPVSHNQHLPARSTPVQLHRPTQNYVNIKSSSPVSPRTIGAGVTYVQGGAAASSAAAAAAAAGTAGGGSGGGPSIGGGGSGSGGGGGGINTGGANSGAGVVGAGAGAGPVGNVVPAGNGNSNGTSNSVGAGSNSGGNSGTVGGAPGGYVAVPMAGSLRYIHPYQSTPTSASVPAVATMVTSASSAPTPVPVPAPAAAPANPPTVSQTPPPSLSGTVYAARDAYRSATTNVGIFLFDLSHDKSVAPSSAHALLLSFQMRDTNRF
ncbi:hypothetical protein E2986_04625 [Frieseomelitta varia]|uniref:Uncharacterized protein n=1 Tax=Frieseomelitta varia TaxID=561572 RepID=A0A833R7R9_9HYME|nr:hypothetical protein E2986_04625 [Frieseomelitta varia]